VSTDTLVATEAVAAALPEPAPRKKKMTLVVMSGDFDKLFGAFIIATGGAAMGMEVTMFFTFWGLRALKKNVRTGKSLFGRMVGMMYGGDITKSNPSKFSFGGMGRWMFGKMMAANNVAKLIELRDMAVMLGVGLYPCQMSMDVMEIPAESFIDGVKPAVGVGFMLAEAEESAVQYFI
jgi:peroxiredoxin family protein